MVAAIRLRELSAEEQAKINKLAHSRTAPARAVERARIIRHASQGLSAPKSPNVSGPKSRPCVAGSTASTPKAWPGSRTAAAPDGPPPIRPSRSPP